MDVLLPHTEREFTDPNYWKKFFERNSFFEWYGDYSKLSAIFEKYIRPTDAILQIGCGNSTLAEKLYDNGFRNVLSIDTDSNVIVKQQKRNSMARPTLKFEACSASEMNIVPDHSVNAIIDKGTLDALLPLENTTQDEAIVQAMFREIERCLLPFGRYIIITLAQQHIIEKLVNFFDTRQFMVRLQKCELTEANFVMPVFVVIVTKLKMALDQRRNFEYLNSVDSPAEPMDNIERLFEKVKGAQQMNWFKHYISRGPVEETSVKIYSMDGSERYELIVVDDQSVKNLCKYGVFIVPFGREGDWLFATPKGRTILRKNCELHRLVVIRLSREQQYASLDTIQSELNSVILDFTPKACIGHRINYLSLGATDVREHVEAGTSQISGKWTVEHVSVNGSMYRRLVFLDSSNLVQSEAEVKRDKRGKWQIVWTNPLCCEHHRHMLVALEFVANKEGKLIGSKNALNSELHLAVLGLGGGILTKVLHDTFLKSTIVGVELDKEIADIAARHFDFPDNSERIRVEICDAYEFLKGSSAPDANDKFDVIFVDLSGPVNDQGLYCPPPQFVTEEALNLMKNSLTQGGVLTLNLVTRDDQLAQNVKRTISAIFPSVYFIKGDEDINEVIICSTMALQKFANLDLAKKRRKKAKKLGKTDEGRVVNGCGEATKWLTDCLAEIDNIQRFL